MLLHSSVFSPFQILKENPDDGFALVHLGFIIKVIDNNPQDGVQLLQAGIDSNAPGTSVGKFFFHLGDGYCRLNQTDKVNIPCVCLEGTI